MEQSVSKGSLNTAFRGMNAHLTPEIDLTSPAEFSSCLFRGQFMTHGSAVAGR